MTLPSSIKKLPSTTSHTLQLHPVTIPMQSQAGTTHPLVLDSWIVTGWSRQKQGARRCRSVSAKHAGGAKNTCVQRPWRQKGFHTICHKPSLRALRDHNTMPRLLQLQCEQKHRGTVWTLGSTHACSQKPESGPRSQCPHQHRLFKCNKWEIPNTAPRAMQAPTG